MILHNFLSGNMQVLINISHKIVNFTLTMRPNRHKSQFSAIKQTPTSLKWFLSQIQAIFFDRELTITSGSPSKSDTMHKNIQIIIL